MKLGLSLDNILQKVWKTDLRTSKFVAVVKAKRINKLGTAPAISFETITRVPGEGYRTHKCYIFAADKNYRGPLSKCPAIKVGCDCERHKFTYEVALYLKGASNIIYSNGAYPFETNFQGKPGCCKHILKALELVKRKGW